MKIKISILLLLGVLLALPAIAVESAKMTTEDKLDERNFVPDEQTAIEVAKAVLRPIYGEDRIRQAKKFYATNNGGIWLVEDAPPSRRRWIDPVIRVQIQRKTGCIIEISGQ